MPITFSSRPGKKATISTGGGKEGYNIYRDSRDPNKSSSIATRDARRNIALGALPNIVASTNIEDRQEPDAAPSFVIPAGQTMGNLPEKEDTTVVNPLGRYMPPSEQVRQQNILQSTYAPRPTYDLMSVIEGEKRPIQYDDAYFKSGSTRADPKFDPNLFLNTFYRTNLPVDDVPEGNVMDSSDILADTLSAPSPTVDFATTNYDTVDNFLKQKGYDINKISLIDDELYDMASGAKLELPKLSEILKVND